MIFAIKGKAFATALLFLFIFIPLDEVKSSPQSDSIGDWANKFGDELWELAEIMTKAKDIKQRYKTFNARVEAKDGEKLIDDIVSSIGVMLNRKINAVNCIAKKAEDHAKYFHENIMLDDINELQGFSYPSSKFSLISGQNYTQRLSYEDNIQAMLKNFTEMNFNRDSHFYDLDVNTNYSSVHVPTNVFEFSHDGVEFIQWSEELDKVFTQNYLSDPALSWQYFGSNLGIMRHYPAMSWNRNQTDTYDCRKRSWYIETATCSKDVVILLDNSGSMQGYRNYVARLTIKYLLDTLSNNDFVNILTYTNVTKTLVQCFEGKLVQATPENINVFNEHVLKLEEANPSNVTAGLEAAFRLLEKYRNERNCSNSTAGCNQAIMLITDGVQDNSTEVFRMNNWNVNDNQSYPVRIFTYLLGQEVTNVREIQGYACMNRGCYSHIRTLDEVADEVLKYVNVIAAPLVLQRDMHPPTWTHAYIDETYLTDKTKVDDEEQDFRLMIAIGVPAYNLSSYGDGNVTRKTMPTLLGVAGTDVPIDDIIKLALPYKLGVNGYSFVVSNNGYVLLHPDLRPYDPKYKDQIKINYNSVDIIEIEQIDDDSEPRKPSELLLQLRESLVKYEKGKMLNVPIKLHYDEMRRVEKAKQDFYFAPIPNTPFTLGIALPQGYGNTWIKVGKEISRNNYTKVNISDFFVGENWKIHPDWVYCRYHYKEGHEYGMEEELRVFLRKMVEPGWKWSTQYEVDEHDKESNFSDLNCGRKSFDDDAYYCNRELVELLVFDAKVTNESYQSWTFKNEKEREIVEKYNATVRYVSTMSGLTRWQFIYGEEEVEDDNEFGDDYSKAIEEPWYQNAIFQHQIDPLSFVYSVKHKEKKESDDENQSDEVDEEIQVSASMAIFPRDGGLEAPSCVVGFQFSHKLMHERFAEITSNVKCDDCIKSCADEEQYCYIIDNNGYIIISMKKEDDAGLFFGEIEKPTMEMMVEEGIFDKVVVYDLQGLCMEEVEIPNPNKSGGLMTPFKFLFLTFKWIITEVFIEFSRMKFWVSSAKIAVHDQYDEVEDDSLDDKQEEQKKKVVVEATTKALSMEDWDEEAWKKYQKEKPKEYEDRFSSCDKKSELYVLQQKHNMNDRGYADNRSRRFYVNMIPNSNLLLVVINKINETAADANTVNIKMTTEPIEMKTEEVYDVPHPCHKLYMNGLYIRRLSECFTEHEDETTEHFKYCSSSARIKYTLSLILLPMLYLMRFA